MATIHTEGSEDLVFRSSATVSGFSVTSPKTIDFDKVETLQDVINILEVMQIQIWDHKDERYDKIRHLLKD